MKTQSHSLPPVLFLIVTLNAPACFSCIYRIVAYSLECQLREMVSSLPLHVKSSTVEPEIHLPLSITALTKRSKSVLQERDLILPSFSDASFQILIHISICILMFIYGPVFPQSLSTPIILQVKSFQVRALKSLHKCVIFSKNGAGTIGYSYAKK